MHAKSYQIENVLAKILQNKIYRKSHACMIIKFYNKIFWRKSISRHFLILIEKKNVKI